MAGYTQTGTVGAVTDRRQFTIAGAAAGQAGDYYNYGKIAFSSGAERRDHDAGRGLQRHERRWSR